MGQAVRRADALGHVEADALGVALGDESREVETSAHDVVDTASFEPVSAHAERRTLNSLVTKVGENVITDIPDIAFAEIVVKRIAQTFLLHHDPHVDIVLFHHLGKNAVEFLVPDLAHPLPSSARFLRENL